MNEQQAATFKARAVELGGQKAGAEQAFRHARAARSAATQAVAGDRSRKGELDEARKQFAFAKAWRLETDRLIYHFETEVAQAIGRAGNTYLVAATEIDVMRALRSSARPAPEPSAEIRQAIEQLA